MKANYAAGPWRGDFGVRVVRTRQTSDANQDLAGNGTYTPASVGRTYTNTLPSLNAIDEVRKDLLVRGAVSRVMARNTYSDLSASTEVSGTTNAATAGNPLLKPYHADQWELGAEWYCADASLLSATVFGKKLDTFIYTSMAVENVSGVNRPVTRPHNADNGETVNGVELQWQQAFGNGFGTLVNYTFTDAKTGALAGGRKLNAVGNSRNQLNASASWDVTPKVSLYANAVNLSNAVIRTNTTDGLPVGVYENGSRYSVGVRARF